MNNAAFISDDYYDAETATLLFIRLTAEDKEYINNINENMNSILHKRWRTIINSFMPNYYNQYFSKKTSQERNTWFKKYLDYPTKDMTLMPEVL